MYCASIGIKEYDKVISIINNYEMAEIRLDLCEFDRRQVKEIFGLHNNLISTFRLGEISEKYRDSIIKTSIVSGAKWLDLDMENNSVEYIKELKEFCIDYDTKLIISIHNYKETPHIDQINQYIQKARDLNADIIKLVFFSNNTKDNETILSLYENNTDIVAFNMGEIGKETRIESLKLGAPFIYVAIDGENTAPGQMTIDEIKKYPYPFK